MFPTENDSDDVVLSRVFVTDAERDSVFALRKRAIETKEEYTVGCVGVAVLLLASEFRADYEDLD